VGAKISTIPWNKAGVVIVSKTKASDVASMIWICFDEDSQSYGLRRWVTDDDSLHDVIEAYDGIDDPDPDDLICVNWLGTLRHKTGTSVILLGDGKSHTAFPRDILNSESGQDFRNYLCRRYYQLPEKGKFNIWGPPQKQSDIFPILSTSQVPGGKWSRCPILGSNTHLEATPESGMLLCPDGASISWFIDEAGDTAAKRRRNLPLGYRRSIIAIRYQNELFHYRNDLHARFGIFDKSVARRVHLIIESPDLIPDQTRSRLKPINGGEVNFSPWADHFAENMPAEIVALLEDAIPDSSTFPDEYAERLASELGSRFRKSATVVRRSVEVVEEGKAPKQRRKRSPSTPSPRKEKKGFDLPESRWDSAGVHAPPAVVSRPCVPLPAGMVTLNEDHPLFVSVFEEWAAKYDEVYKGRIIAICKNAFRTDFVSKVAHAGSLPWQSGWSRDDVYDRLLDESSMTVIALGLVAHDSMIQTMIKSELKGVKPK
jgi:hypothetical protein